MNALIKFAIISAIVIAVLAAVNSLISPTLGTQANNAIVTFLEMMAPVDFIIPIQPIYIAFQIVGNFIFAALLFIIIKWVAQFYTQ